MTKYTFIFGVFNDGKLVFPLGLPIYCTHQVAAFIVSLLDMANYSLISGHYFACDYWS